MFKELSNFPALSVINAHCGAHSINAGVGREIWPRYACRGLSSLLDIIVVSIEPF